MTSFTDTIAAITPADANTFTANPTDDWRQGRTLFGGLSAALCFAACERLVPGLPPLRSAQIAYIGPSAGEARLEPRMLRQGKSVTFMSCDLIADGAVATRALFAFGGERVSTLSDSPPGAPDAPHPEDCPPLFGSRRPIFTQHLDQRVAGGSRPVKGADKGDMLVWVRLLEESPPPGLVALVALGDALPPASMPRLKEPAAISTMTWQFDVVDPARFDPGRWVLIRCTDDAVGHGYSGQSMAMWDADGAPLMLARQSVAVFA